MLLLNLQPDSVQCLSKNGKHESSDHEDRGSSPLQESAVNQKRRIFMKRKWFLIAHTEGKEEIKRENDNKDRNGKMKGEELRKGELKWTFFFKVKCIIHQRLFYTISLLLPQQSFTVLTHYSEYSKTMQAPEDYCRE